MTETHFNEPEWLGQPAWRGALSLLAASIERAHTAGPSAWVLTRRGETVTLSVGQVAILIADGEHAHVYVKAPARKGYGLISPPGDRSIYTKRAIPIRVKRVTVRPAVLDQIPGGVLTAHQAAIDTAARAKGISPWKAKVSIEMLETLERRLGRPLPRPDYVQTREASSGPACWVVKGDPRHNNFASMLRPGRLDPWVASRPPAAMAVGDHLFFWASSPDLAVVGLGELVTVPKKSRPSASRKTFSVRYLTTVLDRPIPAGVIHEMGDFENCSFLKSGPAGTVFPLSPSQGAALLGLVQDVNPEVEVDWISNRPVGRRRLAVPDHDLALMEGGPKLVQHYRRERSAVLVNLKKAEHQRRHGHLKCEICAFDFRARYGSLGAGFCEVHHLKPLSDREGARKTRLADLAVVCANCHRIIHRKPKPISMAAMRRLFTGGSEGERQ